MLHLRSSGLLSVFRVRSLATYLVGSWKSTWLSLSEVITRIDGYAAFLRLVYGQYFLRYSYSAFTLGLPHCWNSCTVTGIDSSSIVVMASRNGTPRTAALHRSGRRLSTVAIRRPPALRPAMASRSRAQYFSFTRWSAQAMKSVNVFIFFSIFPSSYHCRPISLPPRMWAIA